MPITSTYTTIADYILDQLWGFASANILKGNTQYLYERFAGTMETGASVGIGGLAISSANTGQIVTTATVTDCTNLSVTLITSGRPVFVFLIGTDTGDVNGSYVGVSKATAVSFSQIKAHFLILRDASIISIHRLDLIFPTDTDTLHQMNIAPGSIQFIDVVGAGTYVYKLRMRSQGVNDNALIANVKLCAVEI